MSRAQHRKTVTEPALLNHFYMQYHFNRILDRRKIVDRHQVMMRTFKHHHNLCRRVTSLDHHRHHQLQVNNGRPTIPTQAMPLILLKGMYFVVHQVPTFTVKCPRLRHIRSMVDRHLMLQCLLHSNNPLVPDLYHRQLSWVVRAFQHHHNLSRRIAHGLQRGVILAARDANISNCYNRSTVQELSMTMAVDFGQRE